MTPSKQILEKANKQPEGLDTVTIGGAGISAVVVEILNYLDEQAESIKDL